MVLYVCRPALIVCRQEISCLNFITVLVQGIDGNAFIIKKFSKFSRIFLGIIGVFAAKELD